ERPRVDYKKILPEAAYARFVRMRALRKRLAQEEGVPSYVIFTDEEMAGLAQLESPELGAMKKIRGIGEKKVEKYGAAFLQVLNDEKNGSTD
ncbi:MAG TPA: HRDC domain-containing protein, partial [Saprospiraceae bacterium]|nr:HRDC domain-containing protein [Saprospiraceae bacterium]